MRAEFGPRPTSWTAVELFGQLVAPDGCTLDADGGIWAAGPIGDASRPRNFPKQDGEPPRVQPSRARSLADAG